MFLNEKRTRSSEQFVTTILVRIIIISMSVCDGWMADWLPVYVYVNVLFNSSMFLFHFKEDSISMRSRPHFSTRLHHGFYAYSDNLAVEASSLIFLFCWVSLLFPLFAYKYNRIKCSLSCSFFRSLRWLCVCVHSFCYIFMMHELYQYINNIFFFNQPSKKQPWQKGKIAYSIREKKPAKFTRTRIDEATKTMWRWNDVIAFDGFHIHSSSGFVITFFIKISLFFPTFLCVCVCFLFNSSGRLNVLLRLFYIQLNNDVLHTFIEYIRIGHPYASLDKNTCELKINNDRPAFWRTHF